MTNDIYIRLAAIEEKQQRLIEAVEGILDHLLLSKQPLPPLLSQRQTEKILQVSRHTIKRMVEDGLLTPIPKMGTGRQKRNEPIRYRTTQVLALVHYKTQ